MSTLEATDHLHLARAIDLAEGGRGATSPNPLVGAVIVRDGVVLGEGFHAELGGPHAERAALASVEDARGATMYVSLEPCAHTGRTPPCTEAIIEAGISRVVIASDDPTEKASGRGPGILRDEGIEVVFADGEVASRARRLNQPFRKHARTGRPVDPVQVRDDAGRQGRDPHRGLEVDLGRGLAPALAPLAGRRWTRSSSGSARR